MDTPRKVAESSKKMSPMVWLGITAAVLIIGFFAGMQYLKSTSSSANETAAGSGSSGGPQLMGGGPGQMKMGGGGAREMCANGQPKSMMMLSGQRIQTCGMPDSGSVTAKGDASVTITLSTGESKTYATSAETQFIKEGGTGTLADVATGDSLLVIADSTDATRASYIVINPPSPGSTW